MNVIKDMLQRIETDHATYLNQLGQMQEQTRCAIDTQACSSSTCVVVCSVSLEHLAWSDTLHVQLSNCYGRRFGCEAAIDHIVGCCYWATLLTGLWLVVELIGQLSSLPKK